MHATIEAALEAYRRKLAEYKGWLDERLLTYGDVDPMMYWGEDDWRGVQRWNDRLSAMAEALGLTKREATAEDRTAGLKGAARKREIKAIFAEHDRLADERRAASKS